MSGGEHVQAIGDGLPVPTRSGGAFKTAERRIADERAKQASIMAEDGLFDIEVPSPVNLADRFGVPPFSILDRRAGYWQERRGRWLSLGIESELGRANDLLSGANSAYGSRTILRDEQTGELIYAGKRIDEKGPKAGITTLLPGFKGDRPDLDKQLDEAAGPSSTKTNHYAYGAKAITGPDGKLTYEVSQGATSVFDPVLAELAYRWFTARDWRILDPFAGGSVRGIVAGKLERHYMGIDLRPEQIDANRVQGDKILRGARHMPRWTAGDSYEVLNKAPANSVDFVWSCPPYADLEVYSEDPRDLSTMEYQDFLRVHDDIVFKACQALKPDRFAAWVISDVRDKKGNYRGLVHDATRSFRKAGLELYNDAIILDPVGSAAVRAARIFLGGRKLTRMHQHMLVFVKGDAKRATKALGSEGLEASIYRGAEDE